MLSFVMSPFSSCKSFHRCSKNFTPTPSIAITLVWNTWLVAAFPNRSHASFFAAFACSVLLFPYRSYCAITSSTLAVQICAFCWRWVLNIIKNFAISFVVRCIPVRCIVV